MAWDCGAFKFPMAALWVGLFLFMLFKAFTTRSILPDNAVGASMLWGVSAQRKTV